MLLRIVLVAMVLPGIWGAGQLSVDQYQSGDACPILGDTIPACYIAFAAYILIALAVAFLILKKPAANYLFWSGTAIAGGLALLATILELFIGDICPVAFGSVPTCYISLALSMVIAILFVLQSTK